MANIDAAITATVNSIIVKRKKLAVRSTHSAPTSKPESSKNLVEIGDLNENRVEKPVKTISSGNHLSILENDDRVELILGHDDTRHKKAI